MDWRRPICSSVEGSISASATSTATRHAGPRRPVAPAQAHHADGGDQQRRQEARGAGDAHVPLAVGGAHQRRQDALRVHGAGPERPRVRAQLGQRDRPRCPAAPRAGRTCPPARGGRSCAPPGRARARPGAPRRHAGSRSAGPRPPPAPPTSAGPPGSRDRTASGRTAPAARRPARCPGALSSRPTARIARAPPTSSHTYSASPITPSSAATVSGVKCETKFGRGLLLARQPPAGLRPGRRSPRR